MKIYYTDISQVIQLPKKRFKQFLDTTKIRFKFCNLYQLHWIIFYSLISLILSYLPTKTFLMIKKYF